jgi:hypothetical protein
MVTDERVTGAATAPEWTHTTRLDAKPPAAMACAYVSHHLVEHRLFELVDVVRVVAGELVASSALRGRSPLTLTLSLATPLVILRVDTEPAAGALVPNASWDAAYGSRIVGLLSLAWGARCDEGVVVGLWATFDGRRRRHALDSIADAVGLGAEISSAPLHNGSAVPHVPEALPMLAPPT